MNSISVQEGVEVFHLLLLSFLGKRVDKRCYALKGGCNLRFFFSSPRYSEDMDIDVTDLPVYSLQDAINAILNSVPFRQALQVQGVVIEHITEHKQSETTQRWKLGLHLRGSGHPVPTKVEFSRRGFCCKPILSSVNSALVHRYGLPPVMTPHYSAEDALQQKIQALAGRSVSQARDIFDLHLLQSEERMRYVRPRLDTAMLDAAKQHAMDLSFDDFKGHVLAYLQPDDQASYDSPHIWEAMQLSVLEILEAAQ